MSIYLLADMDIGDIIRIGFFLIFFIGPVVLQFLKGNNNKQRPRPRQRPAAQPQANAGNPPAQARVEDEIEAFLRQARQGAPKKKPQPPPQPVQAELVDPRPKQPPRPPRPKPQPKKVEPARKLGHGVRDHVESHMAEGQVTEHSTHLAEKIGTADERLESRLKQTFDHDLGSLASTTEKPQDDLILEGTDSSVWNTDEQTAETLSDAERIANMLREPDGMKDAFILSEIFTRRSNY